MSFRRAADHTLIAQLVGRMVRTPLARRVEDDEFLGSVALFLPHYDEDGLKAIVEKLEDPDTGSPVKVERKADLAIYGRAKDKSTCSMRWRRFPRTCWTTPAGRPTRVALLSLARKLTMDGIDAEAWAEAKTLAVETLEDRVGAAAQESRVCCEGERQGKDQHQGVQSRVRRTSGIERIPDHRGRGRRREHR